MTAVVDSNLPLNLARRIAESQPGVEVKHLVELGLQDQTHDDLRRRWFHDFVSASRILNRHATGRIAMLSAGKGCPSAPLPVAQMKLSQFEVAKTAISGNDPSPPRNYTQEAVADELGVAHSTVSGWERGTRAITVDELVLLAEYFDVAPSELLA